MCYKYAYVCVCMFSRSVMSDSAILLDCVACQAPLSMEFPKQEYWSGLPFPPPGNTDPGIKAMSPVSPALAGRFSVTESPIRYACQTQM